MYVELHPAGLLRLSDARNMRAFHASVPQGQLALFRERLGDNGFVEGEGHVWLSPSLIQALAGPAADKDWLSGFDQMLAYARGKGWLDASGRIRAHIETAPETPVKIPVESFKSLMRHWPAGVAVAATGQGADRIGLTVSSVTCVCASPPILSVCINRASSAHGALTAASHVSFSFLGVGQDDVAQCFAGAARYLGSERFSVGQWRDGLLGQPILERAAGACECEIVQHIDIGTHTMLIAEVASIEPGISLPIVNFDGRLRPIVN